MANGIKRLLPRKPKCSAKRCKPGPKLTNVTTTVNKQDLHRVHLLITGDLLIIGEDLLHITGAEEEEAQVEDAAVVQEDQVEDVAVAQDG